MKKRASSMKASKAAWPLSAAAIGAILFLHLPFLVILLYAVTTDEQTYTFPLPGLTLNWFAAALNRTEMWDSVWLSIRVAFGATVLALILGTLASSAVYNSDFFGKEAVSFLVVLPIALPGIVTGIALRSALSLMDVPFSVWTIVAGHATFCIVTVYNNVIARLRRTSGSLIEASMDLGANAFQTFRFVVLPHIATALLAGGMLSFALSFDEVIVTTFTAGHQETLPIWILTQLTRPRERPLTNVVAVLVTFIMAIPIYLANRLTQESAGQNAMGE
jgi:putative spermidine/putrescine transport system permease protein